ncbi:MAG: ABC transporter permease subunit [Chloroflexota bacterium]
MKIIRPIISFVVILLVIAVLWEGLKLVGGDPWRPDTNPFGIAHNPPTRFKIASDLNLPHIWDIIAAFGKESRRNGPPLIAVLIDASIFTFREAIVGFLLGGILGLLLGVVFTHVKLLERGCMPYVVASQTIPILAIAPMVIIWLKAGWVSVAVISAYLTFFPVTINTLRGLRSPDPTALELMHSYAASTWQILWKLRFPAALPYIFTAFKVSATASVVGAIIGELPSGIRSGLGGAILNFNSYYITSPSRLWAAILASAVVGISFYLIVTVIESLVLRNRRLMM